MRLSNLNTLFYSGLFLFFTHCGLITDNQSSYRQVPARSIPTPETVSMPLRVNIAESIVAREKLYAAIPKTVEEWYTIIAEKDKKALIALEAIPDTLSNLDYNLIITYLSRSLSELSA